uniref:Uncharacterized protein n=1 Tax=Desulfobacca acetoxidans TaxID=60893 RepID=A0A7C3V2U6_9BACT
MTKENSRAPRGRKLEIKVIPPACLDMTLAEIARLLGNGPLLWPGGMGRSQGLKFVDYDLKKKRGRKPKAQGITPLGQASGSSRKPSS